MIAPPVVRFPKALRSSLAGLALLVLPLVASVQGEYPAPQFDPPPRLATTPAELAAIKAAPDFLQVKDKAVQAANLLVEKSIPLADGSGSWVYYYANPDNGQPLTPLSPTEHKDPTTGRIFTDERTLASYRGIQHDAMNDAAVTLGWAYAYTEDPRYAEGVKRILTKLAADYHTYPDRLDRWGHTGENAPLGGRRYVQSLDEAYGVIKAAKGYDLTRNSPVYSDADRKSIEDNFFRPTAQSLLRFNQGINNHQTWYNAGLMAIASVLADKEIAEKVLTMRGGYLDQLQGSMGDDGLWYEGTMAYHLYALMAMTELVDAGKRLKLPMQDEPRFKLLLTAPLHATYPNGIFPAINDSYSADLSMFDTEWRWAWNMYHDPVFAQALARGDETKLHALLGPDAKVDWPPKFSSEALEDAGLAILRMGSGANAVCAFLDYGPHGGGHGHYDKLNLMLFANGREWLLDPGRLTYSYKEYLTWVKTTAAHNTVTIGGRNQQEATGKLIYLQQADSFAAAVVECDTVYPNTHLRRYVLLTPEFLVDIFDVKTSPENTIDLLAHAVSSTLQPVGTDLPAAQPIDPGTTDGYQHITDDTVTTASANSQWDYIADDLKLRMSLIQSPGEQLITGKSIGYAISQKIPTLIRRRHATETRFTAVYDLSGKGSVVESISQEDTQAPSVRVKTAGGVFTVKFDQESATVVRQ